MAYRWVVVEPMGRDLLFEEGWNFNERLGAECIKPFFRLGEEGDELIAFFDEDCLLKPELKTNAMGMQLLRALGFSVDEKVAGPILILGWRDWRLGECSLNDEQCTAIRAAFATVCDTLALGSEGN